MASMSAERFSSTPLVQRIASSRRSAAEECSPTRPAVSPAESVPAEVPRGGERRTDAPDDDDHGVVAEAPAEAERAAEQLGERPDGRQQRDRLQGIGQVRE